MIVPASEDEIIKSGVVSLVGVVIVLPEITGAVVSTINDVIVSELLTFPAESVTVILQSENVPSLKEFRVIVLLSVVAEVVLEEQEPPYVMVPASVDEKV